MDVGFVKLSAVGFCGNRVFKVNILFVSSSSVLFGHNPCSVPWSLSFTFSFILKEWPHVVWYNNHLPVISSQQIMVHECDWGVNSVTGCSIWICHHNVMNHLFIRKSAWNDYLFVAFISIADSAKSNPRQSWLAWFWLCVFWTARNVYQQYHHYFDLFMLTSDFIFND